MAVMCLATLYFILSFVNRVSGEPPAGLSSCGLSLFSAAADKVRVCDLRKFHSIGKLSGGHLAAVITNINPFLIVKST